MKAKAARIQYSQSPKGEHSSHKSSYSYSYDEDPDTDNKLGINVQNVTSSNNSDVSESPQPKTNKLVMSKSNSEKNSGAIGGNISFTMMADNKGGSFRGNRKTFGNSLHVVEEEKDKNYSTGSDGCSHNSSSQSRSESSSCYINTRKHE